MLAFGHDHLKTRPLHIEAMNIDFIICGVEHSGTTLASDLFRQIPGCDSGFECGVLLADSPQAFKGMNPFYNNMKGGWRLTDRALESACAKETFDEFYDSIYKDSELVQGSRIKFDKTPRYITKIQSIRQKCNVPVIAMTKSIEGIAWSDYKRSAFFKNSDLHSFINQWITPKTGYLKSALKGYRFASKDPSCKIIHLEDLAFQALNTCNRMFEHANQAFDPSYFTLANQRYGHTRSNSINLSIATEHMSSDAEELTSIVSSKMSDLIKAWPKPRHSH
jgi:hypothetical protein